MEQKVIELVADVPPAKMTGTELDLKVAWWPSMPLVNKREAPEVVGIGVLYSEELDLIFHAFDTDNLLESLHGFSRIQTIALAQDQNCRVCWKETTNYPETMSLLAQLRQQSSSSIPKVPTNSSGMDNFSVLAHGGVC